MMRSGAGLILVLALCAGLIPGSAAGMEITPFNTRNQSPLVQIFGLPTAGNGTVLAKGAVEGMLALDVASNFAQQRNQREAILLDGEGYRTTLALRFGLADGIEGGIELPFTGQGGGVLDGFIIGWHDFFHLPQGGRDEAPHNRLLYSYTRDGQNRLLVDNSSFGLGDVRLSAGVQLYRGTGVHPAGIALRSSLKLPTGDSDRLQGSGSTDFALWVSAGDDYPLSLGHAALFAAAGGMVMGQGDVLASQQRRLAAFGTLGGGWSPTDHLAFKVQTSLHTPMYDNSDLSPLNRGSVQLVIGGTIGFTPATSLDIGVSEDLTVETSPDVAFHLALLHRF